MVSRRHILIGPLAASIAAALARDAIAQAPVKLNIPETLNRLDQLLASNLSRIGLASAVRTVQALRRQIAPAGYETSEEWNLKFEVSFNEFDETLWKLDLPAAKRSVLADKSTVETFEKAYSKNAAKFSEFYSGAAARKPMPMFAQAMPAEVLVQGQLLFAAILRARSLESLSKAASITAIWPFCG